MTANDLRKQLIEKITEIDDEQQLAYLLSIVNELSEGGNILAEPSVAYGRQDDFPINLTEDQIIGLAEGLQDIRMGRVFSQEEVEVELDNFFKNREWENEEG